MRKRTILSGLLATVLAFAGCGGGGGDGGGGGGPIEPPPVRIQFTPASSTTGAAIALATGAASTNTNLVLEVQARDVSQLYGVAFQLSYPASAVRFRRSGEGPFLASGGAALSVQVAESGSGTLVVGATRLGAASGADGTGVLLTLEFELVAEGTGTVAFSGQNAYAPNGVPQNGFDWLGGSVRVGS
jgi:hypothetical protein